MNETLTDENIRALSALSDTQLIMAALIMLLGVFSESQPTAAIQRELASRIR